MKFELGPLLGLSRKFPPWRWEFSVTTVIVTNPVTLSGRVLFEREFSLTEVVVVIPNAILKCIDERQQYIRPVITGRTFYFMSFDWYSWPCLYCKRAI
jgi:hypothetical protein